MRCGFLGGGRVLDVGVWVLGENRVVWPGNAADGQLFHVEQFEIASKYGGFDGFLTVPGTVRAEFFTVL